MSHPETLERLTTGILFAAARENHGAYAKISTAIIQDGIPDDCNESERQIFEFLLDMLDRIPSMTNPLSAAIFTRTTVLNSLSQGGLLGDYSIT